jgi:2-succinyl-6-hydroxy-2,4-cyclohexadiene-1-carboxylate synthase
VRKYRFNYVFIGEREQPVILFLHGFMGSWQDFAAVAKLAQARFCCLLLDLPGHGKTQVINDCEDQMSEVAIAIIELLNQLSIKQCFLVGYSMGGRLALYLTIYFPEYFFKVILESASPGLENELARKNRIEQDLKLSRQLKSQELSLFIQNWYDNPLFILFAQHPDYRQAIALKLNNNPSQLARSLRNLGLGMQPSLWDQLEDIQTPILLIVGELDQKFIAINQRITRLSPQFKIKIVKNTDHNVHFERSIKFTQLLRNFF